MPDTHIGPAGLRLIKLMVGTPPQTINDLIKSAGVTRTAVMEQLNELVAAKLVDRQTVRVTGRGRPRHIYSATGAALMLLYSGSEHLVVPEIWRAIEEIGGPKLIKRIVRRVSHALAGQYNSRITSKTPRQRLERFVELLREEGVLVEVAHENGHMVVHKRSCPFVALGDEKQTVCALDLEMMTTVIGKPVRRTACRHDGAPCCVIELAGDS
jgi:predicted ArsR family transcriptional regulator